LDTLIDSLSSLVWGTHTLVLLVGTGAYFTLRLRFIQVRRFGAAVKLLFAGVSPKKGVIGEGDVSPFQALMIALAGAIGNGNIAGVATAIVLGGPGAVFWMWVSAVFGMGAMFAESVLGVRFRQKAADGTMASGPMYYIRDGLGWPWLAAIFAFFMGIKALFATSLVQTNSIALVINQQTGMPKWMVGVALAILTWFVIIGGVRSIGRFAAKLTPFMGILYVAGALVVLVLYFRQIPEALALIFQDAFLPSAAIGGFAGATVQQAIRYGVARGVYSNEAGTGSAPVAHGAAQTDNPVRQGMIAMLGVFIDTIVICSMTALVILVTGVWSSGETSTALTSLAFNERLPGIGSWIVLLSSLLFGYSSLISWPYYGEQSFAYLFGVRIKKPYRWAFCFIILLGGVLRVDFVWNLGDVLNGMMAIPNLIGILGLSGVVVRVTREYFDSFNGLSEHGLDPRSR
jgi:AGCS family alanine or glycine:cation symporter